MVIASSIVIYSADALIVSRDDPAQLNVQIDVWPLDYQPGRRSKVRLVSPFGPGQRAGKQACADPADGIVRSK